MMSESESKPAQGGARKGDAGAAAPKPPTRSLALDEAATLVPGVNRGRPASAGSESSVEEGAGSDIIAPSRPDEAATMVGGGSRGGAGRPLFEEAGSGEIVPAYDSFRFPPHEPGMAPASSARQAGLPQHIGHYSVKRLIGEGGMGAVYEAEQENPRRVVALKVMRAAIVSPSTLRRFEYESQLLGRLRHPGIAQIFEAGTHEDPNGGGSVPFYAMEFIPDALSLTDYMTTAGLDVRARMDVFLKVCDAVHHGHQRGIIHRDLKPVNILVDGTGQPKIIDFGVARGGEDDRSGATMQTDAGSLVGTLQYMSPEQCGPDSADLDTRSDVYALGVILFELLTGKLPYDVTKTTIYEATRIIREDPPRRPSAIVARLPKDLETICLKALEKDRDKRYQSAADLAADLLRYMNNEPILARPIGMLGRTIRWVRRNRTIATTSAIAAAVLLTVSTILIAKIIEENHEKNRQLLLAQEANRYTGEFMQSLKGDSAGNQVGSFGTVNVKGVLDAFAAKLDNDQKISSETEAYMRQLIGRIYTNLSQYDRAKENLARSVDIRRVLSRGPNRELAETLHELAAALWWNGEMDAAEVRYEEALAMRRALLKSSPTIEGQAEVAMTITHLGAVRLKQRRLDEAEELYTEALKVRRDIYGAQHVDVAASLSNLGKCLLEKRAFEQSEVLFRHSVEMVERVRGEGDPLVANAAINLGNCLYEIGKITDAQREFQRALDIRLSKYERTHHWVALARLGLAKTDLAMQRPEEALQQLNEAEAGLARLPSDHPDHVEHDGLTGEALLALGNEPEAWKRLEQAMEIVGRQKSPDDGTVAELQGRMGMCLASRGEFEEAEQLLRRSAEVAASQRGDASCRAQIAYSRLAEFYEARGDSGNATLFRSKLVIHTDVPAP